MKQIVLFIVFALAISTTESKAQGISQFFDEADSFFQKYTANGRVDYTAIHSNPETLNSLLDTAENITVSSSNSDIYKAFWINAYNLAVIKGVIDNYPLNSPLDVKGFFDKILYSLGGKSVTLNDIENKMLRAKFNEPRFHFVLVCGAKGCPPIISEAYLPAKVENQLEAQTVKSLNNASFIKISEGKVALSEIFKWYKEDFIKNGQTELDFLNKYRKEKIPPNSSITYYSYNWTLNKK